MGPFWNVWDLGFSVLGMGFRVRGSAGSSDKGNNRIGHIERTPLCGNSPYSLLNMDPRQTLSLQ